MTWSLTELEQWLNTVEQGPDQRTLFDWLEIPPTASQSAIQDAYHRIARTRHPDLFRRKLPGPELDRLVRMYARVTAAYAELRVPEKCAAYLRSLRGKPPSTPPPVAPGKLDPVREMNARALVAYRRAEGSLRTGDRTAAVLHVKMAIAADPTSKFLRAALAELMGKTS